tara:strand:+ start:3959 stop:6595 length:2637 start_codon:yes stop_codon:yes gene_type:complete
VKRLLAATVVLTSLLMLSVTAAWLWRDNIAGAVANRLLNGTGLRITEVTDVQPSLARTTVGALAVEVTGSGRVQRFHDIEISYDVSGLRKGQLQSVRISRADLDLAAGAATAESVTPTPRLTDVSELIRQAPLQSVHIDDLRFQRLPAEQQRRTDKSMALFLHWQDNQLTGQLGDGQSNLQLDMTWQVNETEGRPPSTSSAWPFAVEIRAQTGSSPALAMELAVIPSNDTLQVRLSGLFDNDTVQPAIKAVAEQLSLPALANLPLVLSADIALQATVPDALEIPQTLQLTASIEADGEITVPASLFTDFDAGAVEGHWDEPMTLVIDKGGASQEWEWTINGDHLALNISNIDTGAFQLSNTALTLTGYRLQCLSMIQCEFSASSAVETKSATWVLSDAAPSEPVQLKGPSLTVPTMQGSLEDNILSLQVSAGTQVLLPEGGFTSWSVRDTELTLDAAASLTLPLTTIENLHLQTGELSINLPLLRNSEHMMGLHLHAQHLDTRPLSQFMLDTEFQLSNTYTNLTSINLWDTTLNTKIVAENDIFDFDASATSNGRTVASVNGKHDLATSTGEGILKVSSITFDDADNSLSDFINPLPVPVDLVSGVFGGEAALTWRLPEEEFLPVVTGSVDFKLTDIAGFYDNIGFLNLNTRLHARLKEDLHLESVTEEPFRIGRLDVGFPIEDIKTTYRFDSAKPAIQLRDAEMTMFAGRVTADQMVYDATMQTNSNTLLLERIDIEQILSISAYEGIIATGIVNGEIPMTIRGSQLTVSDGSIVALPPGGIINYRGDSTDTGNNNLDLAYGALSNYHYSQLEADVDYMADGELLLSVRMEGLAPAIDNQRINLNINIQDNIPTLLESLQAGRDIAESVQLQQRGGE